MREPFDAFDWRTWDQWQGLREHIYRRGKAEELFAGRFLRHSAEWKFKRDEKVNQAYAEFYEWQGVLWDAYESGAFL